MAEMLRRNVKIIIKALGCIVKIYVVVVFILLMIPSEFFPKIAGYDISEVDWYHQVPGTAWYMVKIGDNDNIDFVRFTHVSKLLPSHVVKISDSSTYSLSEGSYSINFGWPDVDAITPQNQETHILVKFRGIKDGSFCDFLLAINISPVNTDYEAWEFSQKVVAKTGSCFFVNIALEQFQ